LEYVKDENELIKKQSALYQLYVAECGNNIDITGEVIVRPLISVFLTVEYYAKAIGRGTGKT